MTNVRKMSVNDYKVGECFASNSNGIFLMCKIIAIAEAGYIVESLAISDEIVGKSPIRLDEINTTWKKMNKPLFKYISNEFDKFFEDNEYAINIRFAHLFAPFTNNEDEAKSQEVNQRYVDLRFTVSMLLG